MQGKEQTEIFLDIREIKEPAHIRELNRHTQNNNNFKHNNLKDLK